MRYLKELEMLNLPKSKFAIFGSGPLAVRGLRKNRDIDIIVKTDLWKKLIRKYPYKDKKCNSIQIGNIEIYRDWKPWLKDGDKLVEDAEVIKGMRFVKLEYFVKWKKAMGRGKDKKDIKLVNHYLKSNLP